MPTICYGCGHMSDYPKITINGHELTESERMTMFVAIQSFGNEMLKEGALGNDEMGESIRKGYLQNIRNINSKYISK